MSWESRADVRATLASPASDVNMVMVHKFLETKDNMPDSFRETDRYAPPPSAESFGVVNDSPASSSWWTKRTGRKGPTWATICSRHSPMRPRWPSPARR